jgi:threonylcarbamoyladenosine tRNA methylthiotransferase MtaB
MRVVLTNLGCKLNQAELERLARELHWAGHEVVENLEDADLHLVNSCTVTHRAARDSRKVARRGARVRPGLKTVLTGCYATGSPEEAAALAGVDLVVPNDRKDDLLDLVHRAFPDDVPEPRRPTSQTSGAADGPAPRPARPVDGASDGDTLPVPFVPLAFGNTRCLVKVEDGCNMSCSFCIIPSTRGRQRSRPVAEVVREVASMDAQGFREVVVTGVQISHYRADDATLPDLVEALLGGTRIPRIRLTSIAPWRFDDRLLDLLGHERVCRHVHMSLQSGSDGVLRRMRRPYTGDAYAALVERIRRAVPGVAITTDVIVGFPGESEAEHEESVDLVRRVGFARTHVFSYSKRDGTRAADMDAHLQPPVIQRRTREMIDAAAPAEEAFARGHLGETLPVLFEGERDGLAFGTTDNYVRVWSPTGPPGGGADDLVGTIRSVRVLGLAPDDRSGVRGAVVREGALEAVRAS